MSDISLASQFWTYCSLANWKQKTIVKVIAIAEYARHKGMYEGFCGFAICFFPNHGQLSNFTEGVSHYSIYFLCKAHTSVKYKAQVVSCAT